MPTRKKQDIKDKYGGGYAIFSKDNKARRRRRNVTPKEQQQLNTITKKEISRPTVTSFDDLISKLDYTYDSLATINVIFDSLHFTYINSKDDIEQHKNHTRLGEMEKELLAAYDDLCLQINHLEKDVNKMQETFDKLKTAYMNNNSDDECLSSPTFSSSSSSSPQSIFLESDLNFMNYSTTLLSSATMDNKQFEEQLDIKIPLSHQNYF